MDSSLVKVTANVDPLASKDVCLWSTNAPDISASWLPALAGPSNTCTMS